ncbi:MAG: DUF1566 domain-containing protein [bacterium]|nr:DUF1566 domain-containing protein [bacterium]
MSQGGPQRQQQNGKSQGQNGRSGNRRERPSDRQQSRQRDVEPYKEAIQTSGTLNDTGQNGCYDNSKQISCPGSGKSFYGQDAHYQGKAFTFKDNNDGTVSDLNTGLMWQKRPDLEKKSSYADALADAGNFEMAGYTDWRLPTVKELYSLIDFNGSHFTKTPYIDTDYFDFKFGDTSRGERIIDAQYWTSTEYLGTVFGREKAVFGVNFADGRIKGYPKRSRRKQMNRFVRYVRGNPDYGVNDFVDNADGTISDKWTGLTWQKTDSGSTMNWEHALDYCENLDDANYSDWRLPNAKELQSLVDYTRAPDADNSSQRGPALDPIFDISETESCFWTGTTLMESPPDRGTGSQAVYLTFGQAFGFMEDRRTGEKTKMNVHGAGAQRSDPKSGDPADWEGGFGPQGDEIRIDNYARCVR